MAGGSEIGEIFGWYIKIVIVAIIVFVITLVVVVGTTTYFVTKSVYNKEPVEQKELSVEKNNEQ
jgi:phage shock protein PspC (stress-responsive transcriptional regulator)